MEIVAESRPTALRKKQKQEREIGLAKSADNSLSTSTTSCFSDFSSVLFFRLPVQTDRHIHSDVSERERERERKMDPA